MSCGEVCLKANIGVVVRIYLDLVFRLNDTVDGALCSHGHGSQSYNVETSRQRVLVRVMPFSILRWR